MRLAKLIAPDLDRVIDHEPEQLRELIEELHPEDLADVVENLDDSQVMRLFEALPVDLGADVLARLPEEMAQRILEHLGPQISARMLTEMPADDRADVLQDLPDTQQEQILARIEEQEPGVAEDVRALASYDEETAGGIMTTDYLALWPELTVAQAIDEVRQASVERNLETVYYIYVVAYDKLIGVLSLRDLILGQPHRPISSVMTEKVVSVASELDQEEVARAIARYDLSAIPVVDGSGHMLGVVTVDDVVDVVIEEATEDAQKMAAVVPMADTYFETSYGRFVRNRIIWLLILFVCGLLTTNVMDYYQRQLTLVMDLVVFVPLIISSGGNSGSQSSSLIIRALALGEMVPADWTRVFVRELLIGITLGLILGVVGFARALWGGGINDPTAMGVTVAISVIAVVTLGTLVGSLMPLIIQRAGLDPAVSSTPFVASVVDVIGLVVYFSMAKLIFASMAGA